MKAIMKATDAIVKMHISNANATGKIRIQSGKQMNEHTIE
jgi:hypothetical protein